MTHGKRFQYAGVALLVLPFALLLALRPFDERLGLTGTYYSRVDWSGARFSRVDYQIATDALGPAFQYAADRPFAVTWKGLLAIDRPGSFRFEIVSDDGSSVRIDDRVIIDISGPHGPLAGRGEIELDRGLHPIQIDFFEAGGGWTIELFWAREGEPLTRIPATALLHEPIGMTSYAWLRTAWSVAAFAPLCWIAGVLLLAVGWLRRQRWWTGVMAELRWPPLLALLTAAVILNGLGLWWGFPDGWAPDEIGPGEVLNALGQFFSPGWYSRYPPFQFYLLGMFAAPFALADAVRPSDMQAQGVHAMLFIVNRVVSLMMGVGTIAACYACGRALKDRMAGLIAAGAMAVVLPFTYYAKVANLDVPYLFWFALAMFGYIRILQDAPPSAYRLFALAGMLAICTKDQAYGFFLLPGLHAIVRRFQQLASTGPHPLRRLLTDRVLGSAAAIAVGAFVVFDNLLFNFSGFVEHVRVITGGASTAYQMVPGTVGGRLRLLADIVGLLRWSFGWPLFLLAAAAVAATAVKRDRALWLLLPALSYYVSFLNVVLYAYDRFLLGLCLILAIIMGCRISEWIARRGGVARVTVAVTVLGFALAAVNAASLDAMMMHDSRYAVQRWFRDQVSHDALIVLIGRPEYLPVLDGFASRYAEPPRLDGVRDSEYVVINAKYMRRFGPGSEADELYEQMQRGDGYTLVLREGPSMPWLPLARDPVFQSQTEDPFTNLTKVDPQIEVYRRTP